MPDSASPGVFPFSGLICKNGPVRIKLDIPDKIQFSLKKKAHREGVSVNNLILHSIEAMLSRRKPPVIQAKRPGSLPLDNAKIYELIDFP